MGYFSRLLERKFSLKPDLACSSAFFCYDNDGAMNTSRTKILYNACETMPDRDVPIQKGNTITSSSAGGGSRIEPAEGEAIACAIRQTAFGGERKSCAAAAGDPR